MQKSIIFVETEDVELDDNEEEMAYLDGWDTRLPNFDNTDDYRMEAVRVRAAKGVGFRFTYVDYAVKIVLGSVMRKYFQLDQPSGVAPLAPYGTMPPSAGYYALQDPYGNQGYRNYPDDSVTCCSIL